MALLRPPLRVAGETGEGLTRNVSARSIQIELPVSVGPHQRDRDHEILAAIRSGDLHGAAGPAVVEDLVASDRRGLPRLLRLGRFVADGCQLRVPARTREGLREQDLL